MRRIFAGFIKEIMEKDDKVCFITLDVGKMAFEPLIKNNPSRCFNFGLTEQASISIASGMALEGLKPYVYSITPFLLERPFEQIKLDLVEQNANVKLIGFWNYPQDGPTHLTKNPREVCKVLEIPFYKPENAVDIKEILEEIYNKKGPAFVSLEKNI